MEEDEIVVIGQRPTEPEEDWSHLFSSYIVDFGWLANWGLVGGGGASAPDEPETPEIVVNGLRPSPGQESFDDDDDVFNDGEAPTFDTVAAWLESMNARGLIVSYGIMQRDPEDPSAGYDGYYSTIEGSNHEIESDGQSASNFLRSYVMPEPQPPIDPNTIASNPWDFWLV